MMVGGPLDGKIMAFGGPAMPCINDKGKRVGTYVWDDDHWEYDADGGDDTPMELYGGGYDE
jgi:hypothetical protein